MMEMVSVDEFIENYLDDLDDRLLVPTEGDIDPNEDLDPTQSYLVEWSGEEWWMEPGGYFDELVWGDRILYWNRRFWWYIEYHGMVASEPVHVTLVRTSARTLIAASRANPHDS